MSTPTRDLSTIEHAARRAERRIRAGRSLSVGVTALCVGLVVAVVAVALRKTHIVGEHGARAAVALAALGVVVAAVVAFARALPRRAGAVALDRFHALSDRLSSALSFGELPAAERTPFMDAAIEDALGAVRGVDPRRAVPIRAPRDLGAAAALAVALGAIGVFEVRDHVRVASQKTIDAVDVTADDLDAMREFLRDMEQKQQTDEARAATQEFNQLIEDLAAKRLDRTEAFRKMQALEDKLLEGREADAKALEDALQKIGEELKKADLTKPAGEALDNKNLAVAEKQLKELAKKLREQGDKIDKAQLEKMREALKKASEDQAKRAEAIAKRREELKQDLLQRRQKTGDAGASEQERSLLQKRERELDRLDREQEQQAAAQRQLDRLDRDLQQAAEDLMRDLGMSAKDLEQGAEDINRMAREEMSQEEKEQLRQKLQELREMLRQQGQGGQQQMVRLRKFQQRARGQSGRGEPQQGQGEQGQGQGQQGEEGEEGQDGQGQQGQNPGKGSRQQQAQGQGGRGPQPGQGGETWILGPNGEKIMIVSSGRGQGQQNGGAGEKGPSNPHGWGTGHDGNVQGGATNPNVRTQDTQVAGNDTGQGGSRSEVIRGAAEKGFASRDYQKVYREYHTVAEEALNKDDIPGGYRFYVRRYFQLIRPRDEQ